MNHVLEFLGLIYLIGLWAGLTYVIHQGEQQEKMTVYSRAWIRNGVIIMLFWPISIIATILYWIFRPLLKLNSFFGWTAWLKSKLPKPKQK